MNICTVCYLICYVPDLYANYVNKNANILNIPEKVLIFIGTGFALSFAVVTQDTALITNFAPLFVLDGVSMGMRAYYACKNRHHYLEMGSHGSQAANVSSQDSSGSPHNDTRQTTSSHTREV